MGEALDTRAANAAPARGAFRLAEDDGHEELQAVVRTIQHPFELGGFTCLIHCGFLRSPAIAGRLLGVHLPIPQAAIPVPNDLVIGCRTALLHREVSPAAPDLGGCPIITENR